MEEAAREKGIKLAGLARKGIGGEKAAAQRALAALLAREGTTLRALDPSYPDSADPASLEAWRESEWWLARLEGPERAEALSHLVDDGDLGDAEIARVLGSISLGQLCSTRRDLWRPEAIAEDCWLRAEDELANPRVMQQPGSLSERVRRALLARATELQWPERRLRGRDDLERAFIRGVCEGLSGRPARDEDPVVVAQLSIQELARVRALIAGHADEARGAALAAALAHGRRAGQEGKENA